MTRARFFLRTYYIIHRYLNFSPYEIYRYTYYIVITNRYNDNNDKMMTISWSL